MHRNLCLQVDESLFFQQYVLFAPDLPQFENRNIQKHLFILSFLYVLDLEKKMPQ